MPEALSSRLLRLMFANRTDSGVPKFPAYYSGCFTSRSVRNTIQREGFSEVSQTPFYSHAYYHRLPLIHRLHYRLSEVVSRMKINQLSAFCFTAARK
jgi:hypothetical protein